MKNFLQKLQHYFEGINNFAWWKAHLWIVLAVPALLWWKDSIIFVILLSLFANYESSMAEYKADLAREDQKQKE